MKNFPKAYLSHPKSESDIPHMHIDRLDEIYAMVKSILPFEQLEQTGQIGFGDRSDRSSPAGPLLSANKYVLSYDSKPAHA